MNTPYDKFIGKYVCYGNKDGGFCWGKIKGVCKVNTSKGEVFAFIMTERTTYMGTPYVFSRICHQSGDTLLQVDKINIEQDIVEKDAMFEDLTSDDLFLLIMEGDVDLSRLGNKGLGIKNLCESSSVDTHIVKQVLEQRLV